MEEDVTTRYNSIEESHRISAHNWIRSLLEEARMNLACRISYDDPDTSTDVFTTIEACDIPDRKSDAGKNRRRIGFEAA